MGRYAYLIGASEFTIDSGLKPLVGPPADVRRLAELLERDDRGEFVAVSFLNEPSYQIIKQLYADLSKRNREDTVLVYFSGHGLLDEANRLYLACCDTDATNVVGTAVRAGDILDRMQVSGAGARAMILDCCYSGAIGTEFSNKDDLKQRGEIQLRNMARTFGTAILTSSTDIQVSKDGEISLFTNILVQSIETGDADKDIDGFITLHDLFEYTANHLISTTNQRPLYFDIGGAGSLIVSKSGKTLMGQLRADVLKKLLPYRLNEDISDSTHDFLMSRFSENALFGDEQKREIDALCERYVRDKIRFGLFHEQIIRIKAEFSQPKTEYSPEQTRNSGVGTSIQINKKKENDAIETHSDAVIVETAISTHGVNDPDNESTHIYEAAPEDLTRVGLTKLRAILIGISVFVVGAVGSINYVSIRNIWCDKISLFCEESQQMGLGVSPTSLAPTTWPANTEQLFNLALEMEADGARDSVMPTAKSFEECKQNCAQSPLCQVFTYHKNINTCYLYSTVKQMKQNKYSDSGVRKTYILPPGAPTPPRGSDAAAAGTDSRDSYNPPSPVLGHYHGMLRATRAVGNEEAERPVSAPSIDNCGDICFRTRKCVLLSYDKVTKICHLYSTSSASFYPDENFDSAFSDLP